MRVYIYQAALLCEPCGKAERLRCEEAAGASQSLMETGVGSDGYPDGPHADGGGEAGCPQACDHCGTFLENPLTPDGDAYVRAQAEPYTYPDERDGDVAPWSLVADRAEDDGKPVLAEWLRFYFAGGL